MHTGFLAYKRFRWLIIAILSSIIAIVTYVNIDSIEPKNGGTAYGYTLGSISAFLILVFIGFGIRKRRYGSNLGSVQGWLSAHVYLGMALIIFASLHSGFQLGWNIHSLAYVLVIVVVLTGIYGIVVYSVYPTSVTLNRQNMTRAQMLQEVAELDRLAQNLAVTIDQQVAAWVDSAVQGTRLGGGVWAQLSGKDRSFMESRRYGNADQKRLTSLLAEQLAKSQDPTAINKLQELMQLVTAKRNWLKRLRSDISMLARMEIWRYLHIPLSLALLASLIAHVVSVFVYW